MRAGPAGGRARGGAALTPLLLSAAAGKSTFVGLLRRAFPEWRLTPEPVAKWQEVRAAAAASAARQVGWTRLPKKPPAAATPLPAPLRVSCREAAPVRPAGGCAEPARRRGGRAKERRGTPGPSGSREAESFCPAFKSPNGSRAWARKPAMGLPPKTRVQCCRGKRLPGPAF